MKHLLYLYLLNNLSLLDWASQTMSTYFLMVDAPTFGLVNHACGNGFTSKLHVKKITAIVLIFSCGLIRFKH